MVEAEAAILDSIRFTVSARLTRLGTDQIGYREDVTPDHHPYRRDPRHKNSQIVSIGAETTHGNGCSVKRPKDRQISSTAGPVLLCAITWSESIAPVMCERFD